MGLPGFTGQYALYKTQGYSRLVAGAALVSMSDNHPIVPAMDYTTCLQYCSWWDNACRASCTPGDNWCQLGCEVQFRQCMNACLSS